MINEINVDFPVLPVSKYAEQLNQEAAANTVAGSGAHLIKTSSLVVLILRFQLPVSNPS